MRALQSTRKRSWKTTKSQSDSSLDISSLTGRNSSAVLEEYSSQSPVPPPRSPKPKKRTQFATENLSESAESLNSSENTQSITEELCEVTEEVEEPPTPTEESSTEWYLNPNGQLNERSLQMPKVCCISI